MFLWDECADSTMHISWGQNLMSFDKCLHPCNPIHRRYRARSFPKRVSLQVSPHPYDNHCPNFFHWRLFFLSLDFVKKKKKNGIKYAFSDAGLLSVSVMSPDDQQCRHQERTRSYCWVVINCSNTLKFVVQYWWTFGMSPVWGHDD